MKTASPHTIYTISRIAKLATLLIAVSPAAVIAQSISPPGGWQFEDSRTLVKQNSRIALGNWQPIDGHNLKSFVLQFEKQLLPQGVQYISTKTKKYIGKNYLIGRLVKSDRKKGISLLVGCEEKSGMTRIIVLTMSPTNEKHLREASQYIEKFCIQIPTTQADTPATVAPEVVSEQTHLVDSKPDLSDLAGVWLVGDFKVSRMGSGLDSVLETYLIFRNGYATNNLGMYLKEGDESRNNHPKNWRRYKVVEKENESDLLLSNSDGGYNRPFVSFPLKPAVQGELLQGCWENRKNSGNSAGNSNDGTTSIGSHTTTYCFKNEEFSVKRSSMFSVSGGVSGAKAGGASGQESEQNGTYSATGHAISFYHNDGRSEHTIFAWHSTNQSDNREIVIGGSTFKPL